MGIIYIMLNVPFIWKVKIGITTTGRSSKRRHDISATTPGFVFPIWLMVLPFGTARLESDLHRIFKKLHSPFSKGSGRTEWFLFPAGIAAWLIINMTAALYWSPVFILVWLAFVRGERMNLFRFNYFSFLTEYFEVVSNIHQDFEILNDSPRPKEYQSNVIEFLHGLVS